MTLTLEEIDAIANLDSLSMKPLGEMSEADLKTYNLALGHADRSTHKLRGDTLRDLCALARTALGKKG